MTLQEVVERVNKSKPGVMKGIPPKKALAVLREVLSQISREIDGMEEGVLVVPPLGRFRARVVTSTKDGQQVTTKRVVFMAARPKAQKWVAADV